MSNTKGATQRNSSLTKILKEFIYSKENSLGNCDANIDQMYQRREKVVQVTAYQMDGHLKSQFIQFTKT